MPSTGSTTWAAPGTSTTTRPACDVPTTTYSYFFELNPQLVAAASTGAEIKQYADDVADKYDVRRHIRFNTTVEGARWDEEAGLWRVALGDGQTLSSGSSITATGFLSQPHTPRSPASTSSRAGSSTPPRGTTASTRRATRSG